MIWFQKIENTSIIICNVEDQLSNTGTYCFVVRLFFPIIQPCRRFVQKQYTHSWDQDRYRIKPAGDMFVYNCSANYYYIFLQYWKTRPIINNFTFHEKKIVSDYMYFGCALYIKTVFIQTCICWTGFQYFLQLPGCILYHQNRLYKQLSLLTVFFLGINFSFHQSFIEVSFIRNVES